jgi:hypothetical protein
MDVLQERTTLGGEDTALQDAAHTASVEFALDDAVRLGSPREATSRCLIFREYSLV